MLTEKHCRMLDQIINKASERILAKDDEGITLDHAAFEALTSVVGAAVGEEHQDAAALETILVAALELLHELPVPSAEGDYIRAVGRHSGAKR